MNLPNLSSSDLVPVLPTLILMLGAIFVLLSEVFLTTGSRAYQAYVTAATALLAMVVALANAFDPARTVFLGFAVHDPFSMLLTAVICLGLLLAALAAPGFLRARHAERGEFYALSMFAAAGMSLLSISNEFITLFINLEVMSIATYALASYLRRGPRPAEAGFKYFILGSFSSALLLYGAALLYGATGSTHFTDVGARIGGAVAATPALAYCGLALVAAGFAFKVAAVPFHMWTPDVYEGAPTPVTALMSVGVKAAAFAAMVRVFLAFGRSFDPALVVQLLSVLAFLTMIVGNLLAIPQRNVKRMLAYSSIGHAGYLLVAVAALFAHGGVTDGSFVFGRTALPGGSAIGAVRAEILQSIVFYLLAYTVTTVGAFATLGAIERREDEDRGFAWDLDRFAGLSQRRPGWAFAMAAFMLSLGGIPPTVGFMAKLLVFRSAIDAGLVGLVVVGVLSSAAAVYYYLRVVVYMYMRPSTEGAVAPDRNWSTEIALTLSTVAVILLGILPGTVSEWLGRAGIIFGQ